MDNLSEQNYLSSKDAGAILGYTHDYISRLCRQGKMSGIQKGREWYVTKEELDAFKQRHEVELQEKKKELSKKFSRIRLEHEAKKRANRESLQQNNQNDFMNMESADITENKKGVSISIPREFVATCVLVLSLFAPSFLNQITQAKQTPISSDGQVSLVEISSYIEKGIEDTIYAQATVVEPVAAIFSFAPYLADGYWQFFTVVGQLPKEMYLSLRSIGNGYLTLYVLQGEALYESVENLNTMGAVVLRGYELVGESFVFGARDIIDLYARIFHVDSYIQNSANTISSFSGNVSDGFEYATESAQENILNKSGIQFASFFNSFKKNLSLNITAMGATINRVSGGLGAYVGSLFEFNLVEKESRIRAIKLQE